MSWVDYVLLEFSYYRGHVIALNEHRSVSSLLPNGLRYWRGGLAKLANIIAPNFAKCAAKSWGDSPVRCTRCWHAFGLQDSTPVYKRSYFGGSTFATFDIALRNFALLARFARTAK